MIRCRLACSLLVLLIPALPVLACEGALHIELEHSGVYGLTFEDVVDAQPGLADCRSDDLMLTTRGNEVPIRVADGGDGLFGSGDRIEWIGLHLTGPQSWNDPYSVNNVYVLAAGAGKHSRFRDAGAETTGHAPLERHIHLEQDNLMIRLDQSLQKPGEEPDVWQWAKLTTIDAQPYAMTFDLPDLMPATATATLTINFRGLSRFFVPRSFEGEHPADHTVEPVLNGKPLDPISWDTRAEIRRDIAIPVGLLKSRGNTLTLHVPKRQLPWDTNKQLIDVVMFNWMEWRYPIAGNLDQGGQPFMAADDSHQQIDVRHAGDGVPVLYGMDGVRRPAIELGGDRFAFAAAAAGTALYPVLAGGLERPKLLRAVAKSVWEHPDEGYDYLIVSHPTLMDAIEPLAEFHRERGLRVAVLDINDVYDEFNYGIPHPQAVRNLMSEAWHDWPEPRPKYLLLVGKASFDIRHTTYDDTAYAKFASHGGEINVPGAFMRVPGTPYPKQPAHLADSNLIPTWQYPSPEGQSASDNPFVSVDGDDWHPVMAVGRFPVVDPADVTAIVNKTIKYMTQRQPGTWQRDVMFITDESVAFQKSSDEIAREIDDQGFATSKVYASADEANNLAHQSAIHKGLDSGQLLVHFIGHGGRYIWRTGPPDLTKNHDLFTLDDVAGLDNGDRLPMILSMTCYSAPFDNPSEDSIGERFLREADRGAVAVFAASWRNAPSTKFSEDLVRELLQPGVPIGDAILNAKRELNDRSLVALYNLLGDPAVILKRPQDGVRMALDTDRWSRDVVVQLPDPAFRGSVTVDWLDGTGTVLGTDTYQMQQSQFHLRVPAAFEASTEEVRVYAISPRTSRDAVGALSLIERPVPPQQSWTERMVSWWKDVTRPPAKPKPWTSDTIARGDFDGTDLRPVASDGTYASPHAAGSP